MNFTQSQHARKQMQRQLEPIGDVAVNPLELESSSPAFGIHSVEGFAMSSDMQIDFDFGDLGLYV